MDSEQSKEANESGQVMAVRPTCQEHHWHDWLNVYILVALYSKVPSAVN